MKKQTELIVKKLISQQKYNFNICPEESILDNIAEKLDLLSLNKLSFIGQINCIKNVDFRLKATLKAIVTQKCVATLEPVQTKLATKVERLFIKGWKDTLPSSTETVLETVKEVLPEKINLMTIIVEELSLELPAYPRAEEAIEFLKTSKQYYNQITDKADNKPFSILSGLKEKLESKNGKKE